MSIAKRQAMLSAIDSYLRGYEPPPVEIATAPRLDRWEAVVRTIDGKKSLVLKGDVINHPVLGDDRITTSDIVWIDRKCRWARSKNRVYVLDGRMIDDEPLEL